MPSARSILLQNSKNHLTILRLDFLCSNLSRRDLQLDGDKFNSAVNLKRARSAATSHVVGVGGSLRGKGATS